MRRKSTQIFKVHVLIITAIISLNVIGIAYAHWNGTFKSINKISMGDIDPQFCGAYANNLSCTYSANELNINGTITITDEKSSPREMIITYFIRNNGSTPIKCITKNSEVYLQTSLIKKHKQNRGHVVLTLNGEDEYINKTYTIIAEQANLVP
ncbi:hypothetical protein PV797_19425 [Clostridiaceae bacterium M8S5]|nr:hypothetical protein PV797_19425 [Clostridiaceae bacterium M8S5]